MNKMKKCMVWILAVGMCFAMAGCSSSSDNSTESKEESVTIKIAAAASLENCFEDKLIPMFEKENENVKIQGVYDSSGKLQTQIEEGLDADIFFSAATQQMDALIDEDLIDQDTQVKLLENKLVLIKGKDTKTEVTDFENVLKADKIALGDPESVPAGQYAKEVFEYLKSYDDVMKKASLGTNVTEVLSWVEAGSAQVGVVYATDAASSDQVEVLAQAKEDYLETPVIYPTAMVKATKHEDQAKAFLEFLQSEEALEVFESYGFTINK